ncbi:MAG TPA: NnrS family protein [Candidatus Eisenbacteria bacterium]
MEVRIPLQEGARPPAPPAAGGEAKRAPGSPAEPPDPYRILFPMGVAYGIAGAALWPLHALGLIPYPAQLHWTLMAQGFQHCFILGFLLTAMPSFMHAEHCRRSELVIAVVAMAGFGVAAVLGWAAATQACYLATLALIVAMAFRRRRQGAASPPVEFSLVAFGIALGAVGSAMIGGAALGLFDEPAPRLGIRLVWMGMILSAVLGVGGLLVPTFSAMREPLEIPGIARPHERRPRRILYGVVALLLLCSLILEGAGHAALGAILRAATASGVLLLVWKLFRRPGRADLLSYAIWAAGWSIFAGLWLMAFFPSHPLLGAHFVLIGGFGLLSAGIGTRVVVRHGGHPLPEEGRVLRPAVIALLAATLAARAAGELAPGPRLTLLAASALAWIAAWTVWAVGAAPRIRRRRAPRADAPRTA